MAAILDANMAAILNSNIIIQYSRPLDNHRKVVIVPQNICLAATILFLTAPESQDMLN